MQIKIEKKGEKKEQKEREKQDMIFIWLSKCV